MRTPRPCTSWARRSAPKAGRPSASRSTNLYLTEEEYALLSRLEAAPLHKVRHAWPAGGREYSVDAFTGDLEGLVLAEIELGPDEPLLPPPPLTAADVTHDDRFSGGRLAALPPEDAVVLLADVAALLRRGENR